MFFFFYDPDLPIPMSPQMRRFEHALTAVSEMKPNLSVSNFRLFLYLANNQDKILAQDGWTMTDIARNLRIPFGTLSRQLDVLETGYGAYEGLGLTERGIDETNTRARRVRLTKRGDDFARRLDALLNRSSADEAKALESKPGE